LDSDTVVLKDPKELMDSLSTVQQESRIEYVGFGCTGKVCKNNGYMRPSNGLMGSRRGAFIMHDIKKTIHNFLLDPNSKISPDDLKKGESSYFVLGKSVIWFVLDSMTDNHSYHYFHIDPNLLGIRDAEGEWVTNRRLFDTKRIKYKDEDSMIMVIFYNSEFQDPDLMRSIKETDILDSKMQIARFFKRALE